MSLLDQELRDALGIERTNDVTIFTGWAGANALGYDTKTNFKFNDGLVPKRGEKCRAYVEISKVYSPEEWQMQIDRFESRRDTLQNEPEKLERLLKRQRELVVYQTPRGEYRVILSQVPVFQRGQMIAGKFRDRTRAFIDYCKLFWRPSNSTDYIKKNPDPLGMAKWWNIDNSKKEWELDKFIVLNENLMREHVNHRNIYGVKADARKLVSWGAIDLDAHLDKGDNPHVFLRQAEVLVRFLHGKGWYICLREDVVTGLHMLKRFPNARPLEAVQLEIVEMLKHLSDLHPELDAEAVAHHMKPFRSLEYFPKVSNGFRLPMGRGYTALIDRPLDRVHYHTINGVKRFGADIESFMGWDGTEMSIEAKLDFIRQRLPANRNDEEQRVVRAERTWEKQERKADKKISEALISKKVFGPLKGRYRKVLVDFYSGRVQEPKSLQLGILLGVNALWAQGFAYEDRTKYLLDLLQNIQVTNPAFSSRLNAGDWDLIETDIDHIVEVNEKMRSAANAPARVHLSCQKLRAWATAMGLIGFDFSKPNTWSVAGANRFNNLDIALTEDDKSLISEQVRPVFHCNFNTACDAVVEISKIVANKASNGDGISKEYRRAVLTDLGVKCQHNSKLADCWDILTATGFLRVKEQEQLANRHEDGRARVYGIGIRLMKQFFGDDPVPLPAWLAEDMADAGQSLSWTIEESLPNAAVEKRSIAGDERKSLLPTPPPHT